MSPAEPIQQLLARKPGLKAQQIADELGLDRSQVVAALHSLQSGEVTQDNAYRWWARSASPQASGAAPAPRTFLASLCRYYLECLARESGSGVSIPVDSSDYVALSELPFTRPGHDLWPSRCRPEWDWREAHDPDALSGDVPLAELIAPGNYNRAVLFGGTRSPYTYGLEIETAH